MQLVFVAYIVLLPIFVSSEVKMIRYHQNILLVFDIIFVIDRILDLFVGFYRPDGQLETRLLPVIQQNFSSRFVMELIVSFGPTCFLSLYKEPPLAVNTIEYMFFKIPRYGRLFEIDSQIEEIIEYYGQQKTVFEIKRIEHYLGMAKFALSTLINLHLLTCIMIVLCICKPDGYKSSWMYGNILGDEETKNNFIDKYVIAVYFVTTTLTTCGFGDLSATSGDWYESMSIMGLQFVGMLFYSLTI